MAQTRIDALILGRGPITNATDAASVFTANNAVDFYSALTTYSQYNCAESGGHMWRSKVAGNIGNTPASSPNYWERLYSSTKDGDFCFVIGSGATIMQRQGGVWLVFGNHPSYVAAYDEPMDVIVGVPVNDNEITGPVLTGAFIVLPLDSRDLNTTEYYVVGSGDLEVRLNGVKLEVGVDWLEVGATGSNSTIIQSNIQFEITDRLVFRRLSHHNLTGYGGGGGGGSVNNLQDAYNGGNTIAASVGVPFTVTGLSGKVAQFNGDIGVTGLIDPKGMTFSREAVDPLGANDGIWVNSAGELNYKQNGVGNTNITQALSGALSIEATTVTLTNNTGFTITEFVPVCLNSSGELKLVSVSSAADAESFVGLTAESISHGASGKVCIVGKLTNISTAIALGSGVWVSSTGSITATPPSIGVGGFISGDWVIKIGLISKNLANPSNKDIIISSVNVGQL